MCHRRSGSCRPGWWLQPKVLSPWQQIQCSVCSHLFIKKSVTVTLLSLLLRSKVEKMENAERVSPHPLVKSVTELWLDPARLLSPSSSELLPCILQLSRNADVSLMCSRKRASVQCTDFLNSSLAPNLSYPALHLDLVALYPAFRFVFEKAFLFSSCRSRFVFSTHVFNSLIHDVHYNQHVFKSLFFFKPLRVW